MSERILKPEHISAFEAHLKEEAKSIEDFCGNDCKECQYGLDNQCRCQCVRLTETAEKNLIKVYKRLKELNLISE